MKELLLKYFLKSLARYLATKALAKLEEKKIGVLDIADGDLEDITESTPNKQTGDTTLGEGVRRLAYQRQPLGTEAVETSNVKQFIKDNKVSAALFDELVAQVSEAVFSKENGVKDTACRRRLPFENKAETVKEGATNE